MPPAAGLLCCAAWLALAQEPAPPAPVPNPPFTLSAGLERHIDRDSYHFDNASRFDTAALVPHFFEQRYVADNTWFNIRAAYRVFGRSAETALGATPRTTTTASDIDTFFQPSGDVVTSGTRGGITLRSISIDQRVGFTTGRSALALVVRYRRSRANFLPDDRIITHSQPASVSSEFITTRETTISEVVSMGVTTGTTYRIGDRWTIALSADALPVTRAGLVVQLPDKYPGQNLEFTARAFGADGGVAIARHWRCLTASVEVHAQGAWPYQRTASYSAQQASVGVWVTRTVK